MWGDSRSSHAQAAWGHVQWHSETKTLEWTTATEHWTGNVLCVTTSPRWLVLGLSWGLRFLIILLPILAWAHDAFRPLVALVFYATMQAWTQPIITMRYECLMPEGRRRIFVIHQEH
ncbi:MAG: hypothetical protein C7B45_16805 [Sulfobacillus acidophilus]|uniref:Uncharacterized protein n=1 Tax=Sulfobacillus acidophilus TaxID=53633 RepID=A0A2T2WCU9_9FIRM|nr:MAG: hypothetical protein C7B45_16805 [Sulfobacillus acidophilus]